jgi:hypothetical protein
MLKKIFFSISIIFLSIFLISQFPKYFPNSYNNLASDVKKLLPKEAYVLLRFIFKNEINVKRNLNDYNVSFLPETEFINLKFNKIKLNNININEAGYKKGSKGKYYSFFINTYQNKIVIVTANNQIVLLDTDQLNLENPDIKEINHNLGYQTNVKGSFIYEDHLYLSYVVKFKNDCNLLNISKAKIDLKKELVFNKITTFDECGKKIQAGKIQPLIKNNSLFIVLSTAADILINSKQNDKKPQDDKSIFGKVLLVNEASGEYEIISKGHRNSLGLYVNSEANVILNTENGPNGGDEINKIDFGKNYGWDIASYGKKYDSKKADYKLSHENYGFEEPIFSFVPSIGISEIIRVENNFSEQWKDNFLVGSLNSKHLYRIKFNRNFKKIIFFEKIFIGERIRSLFYLQNEKIILLALEESGSLGVLKKD